ncbi:Uncharacterized protein SCF082_LOCUS25472 [Durusdinium trenchii]|uniref:Uncharacterized protein n=1 Tax=Durusdinium trenchii TaxID=1381693 RepID=A0ABP0M403_9DINO
MASPLPPTADGVAAPAVRPRPEAGAAGEGSSASLQHESVQRFRHGPTVQSRIEEIDEKQREVPREVQKLFRVRDANQRLKEKQKELALAEEEFVFFAGLEGTGHHFWKGILLRLPSIYVSAQTAELSKTLFNGPTGDGLFSSLDEYLRVQSGQRVVSLMDADIGMMSYPNFEGVDRATQNPDIFELAKLAEAAGVDLRIVLLTRHPSDLVQSEMKNLHEINKVQAVRKISTSMALLSEQLNFLDPSFVECWRDSVRAMLPKRFVFVFAHI